MKDIQEAGTDELLRILVHRGLQVRREAGETIDPSVEEIVLDLAIDGARYLLVRLPAAHQGARLSPREQEIVRLVALGHSNKIIGDVLNISSWTVCTHLRRVFAKLGVGSRAAMVAQLLGAAGAVTRKPAAAEETETRSLAASKSSGR